MEFASTPFNCAPPSFRSPLAPFREAPRGQGAILQRARTDHRPLITDHRPERRPPFDLASKQSFCGRSRRAPTLSANPDWARLCEEGEDRRMELPLDKARKFTYSLYGLPV